MKKIDKRKKFKKQREQNFLGHFDSLYQLHLTGFDNPPQYVIDYEYTKIRKFIKAQNKGRYIKEGTEKGQALAFFRAWLESLYLEEGIRIEIEDNEYLKVDFNDLDQNGKEAEFHFPHPNEIDEVFETKIIQGSVPVEIYSFQDIQNPFYRL